MGPTPARHASQPGGSDVPRATPTRGTSRVDAYASMAHYAHHLEPVFDALSPEERGTFYTRSLPPATDGPILVASRQDGERTKKRPTILVEHGCGLAYDSDHGSYSGGKGWDHAVLFLAPNVQTCKRWGSRYPETPCEVVGSPRLDELCNIPRKIFTANVVPPERSSMAQADGSVFAPSSEERKPEVAISFHWNCGLNSFTQWAFPFFAKALPRLAEEFDVIGHAHPRAWRRLQPIYRQLGIEPVRDFDEVVARATLYVCDNSSTMYEWAALDRPVLALDAPWYDRTKDVNWRFWSHVPGPSCDDPTFLNDAVREALRDPPKAQAMRQRATGVVFPLIGGSAERATNAIRRHVLKTPSSV